MTGQLTDTLVLYVQLFHALQWLHEIPCDPKVLPIQNLPQLLRNIHREARWKLLHHDGLFLGRTAHGDKADLLLCLVLSSFSLTNQELACHLHALKKN
jgi:hypothetical protein